MSSYPNTGSTLTSRLSTSSSTNMIIQVEMNDGSVETIGAVQELTEQQSRGLARIVEIGTDGVIEIIPNKATEFEITLSRVVFDGLNLPEGFGRGFRNIQSQRFPFNLQVVDINAGVVDSSGGVNKNSTVVTTYHNCWFSRTSTPLKADNYIIIQQATVWCEFVSSMRAGDSVAKSQGAGGGRSMLTPGQVDSIESASDTGRRLGSLDAAGILLAGLNLNNLS
jgi:hypothetical protein